MKLWQRVKEFFKRNEEQPANDARLGLYDLRPADFRPPRSAHQANQPTAPSTVGDANAYDRLPDYANKYDKLPDTVFAERANEERYVGLQFLEDANEALRQQASLNEVRTPETYVGSKFLHDANEAMRPQEVAPQRERRGTFGQELKREVKPEQKPEPIEAEPTVQRRGTFGQFGDQLKPHLSEAASSILEQNREHSHQSPNRQKQPEHQLGAPTRPNLARSVHLN